jgi:O-antigen/teichoic acid export membrane protein
VPLLEAGAIACTVVFYLVVLSRSFSVFRQRIDHSLARAILRRALPIGASELVWAVKIYFATVFLGMFVGGPEVGWFGAAHRVVISLHTFVWLYFFNLLPSLARSTQRPPEVLRSLMQTSIQVTAWSAMFLGAVGAVFAEPLMTFLYGSQYREAASTFRVLIWLIPLAFMSGHYRYALIAYDRQHLEFLCGACGAGLNILLNLLLTPRLGLIGAAWALVASEVLIWGCAYCFVRRTITCIAVWPYAFRPLVGGAILAGALCLLPTMNIWMAAGSALGGYGLILSMMQPNLLADIRLIFASNQGEPSYNLTLRNSPSKM